MSLSKETIEILETLIPELRESEDEKSKNKSGYYKGGKFWKASTLWNAVKNKTPQRVENRYILQQCSWNIGTLQDFANEIKNVQETNLDYPIILDISGHILDGAHRVVKAYLEGKDINVVYLGDDEWPEPDYDEEKAVKESRDEQIRKAMLQHFKNKTKEKWCNIPVKDIISWLEKQEKQPKEELVYCLNGFMQEYIKEGKDEEEKEHRFKCYQLFWDALEDADFFEQKEQKPAEWSEEDSKRYVSIRTTLETSAVLSKEDYDANVVWLRDLVNAIKYSDPKPSWEPSDEELVALKRTGSILRDYGYGELAKTVFMIEGKLANLAVLNKSIWKPSEEQMGALSWMLENARGNIDFDPLKDLYKQLKKLM